MTQRKETKLNIPLGGIEIGSMDERIPNCNIFEKF